MIAALWISLWSLSFSTSSAWVMRPSVLVSHSGPTTKTVVAAPLVTQRTGFRLIGKKRKGNTQLHMFDWFNKPSVADKEKKEETAKKQEPNIFLNMFQQPSHSPTTKAEVPEDVVVEEIKDDPIVETNPEAEAETETIVETTKTTPEVAMVEKAEETPTATTKESDETEIAAAGSSVSEIHSGTVRWFDRRKGFGFIIPDAGGNSSDQVFVHQSEIQAPGFRFLFDGESVEYVLVKDENGRHRATHVTGPKAGDVKLTMIRRKEAEEKARAKEENDE